MCGSEEVESGLARVGPTTPKRATTSLAASVDPTEARKPAHFTGPRLCTWGDFSI
jgi:hypothetical protein